MTPRLDNVSRWTKVASDLFAVLSEDGVVLHVGWRRPDTSAPVTCAVARLGKPVDAQEWADVLATALRLSTIGRDRAARAAAIVMVTRHGGAVYRFEDREPELKVN